MKNGYFFNIGKNFNKFETFVLTLAFPTCLLLSAVPPSMNLLPGRCLIVCTGRAQLFTKLTIFLILCDLFLSERLWMRSSSGCSHSSMTNLAHGDSKTMSRVMIFLGTCTNSSLGCYNELFNEFTISNHSRDFGNFLQSNRMIARYVHCKINTIWLRVLKLLGNGVFWFRYFRFPFRKSFLLAEGNFCQSDNV